MQFSYSLNRNDLVLYWNESFLLNGLTWIQGKREYFASLFFPTYISCSDERHCLSQHVLFSVYLHQHGNNKITTIKLCATFQKCSRRENFKNHFSSLPPSPHAPQALLYWHLVLPCFQWGLFLLQQYILEASGSQLCVKSWTKPISLPLPLSPFPVVCPFYLNIASRLMIHSSKGLLCLADYTVKSAILFMFKIQD